jgi:hypothetical protein
MSETTQAFEFAIIDWKKSATGLAAAEGEYARAYGEALAKADGKTESIRAGQAELATAEPRARRDLARIDEQAARWRVQYQMSLVGRPWTAAAA